ncbi:hypothetical protein BTM25_05210 [Actinomadura rubteroloni]|uniref:PASTA domain-containing protein n=1 Tax=Actinomadura rubteroloni TaxID=1926885 RepID=A0A2P4UM56_9ACTN|nr:hypothetical protein [Actinomadura rubteroloni]POM26133.1 hypothetical protein BTM25_05210 [Actinomadura rubteroloni]
MRTWITNVGRAFLLAAGVALLGSGLAAGPAHAAGPLPLPGDGLKNPTDLPVVGKLTQTLGLKTTADPAEQKAQQAQQLQQFEMAQQAKEAKRAQQAKQAQQQAQQGRQAGAPAADRPATDPRAEVQQTVRGLLASLGVQAPVAKTDANGQIVGPVTETAQKPALPLVKGATVTFHGQQILH